METGYDEFLRVLKNFRTLSATAIGAGAVVPFACYLAKIIPPWPPGIMLTTAIVELVALVLAFQLTYRFSRKSTNITVIILTIAWLCGSIVYLVGFASLTYITPLTGERWVKGFVCLPDIASLYSGECPFLNTIALKDAQWDAFRLWEEWSIAIAEAALAAIWFFSFMALAALIGSFMIFQMRRTVGRVVARAT
jgi:hypothetical protein